MVFPSLRYIAARKALGVRLAGHQLTLTSLPILAFIKNFPSKGEEKNPLQVQIMWKGSTVKKLRPWIQEANNLSAYPGSTLGKFPNLSMPHFPASLVKKNRE